MMKRERVSDSGLDSMRGREISMGTVFTSGSPARHMTRGSPRGRYLLLGVELDDELLLDGHLDLVPGGQAVDGQLGLAGVQLEPAGLGPAGLELDRLVHVQVLAHALLDLDDVARLDLVGGDVDLLAVDGHVRVADQLARLVAAAGQAAPVDHVVQPGLQQLEEGLAGDALPPGRLDVVVVELLLEDAVDAAGLLLLPELEVVLALLEPPAAVLAGRVGALLHRALGALALGALEEELGLLAPAEPAVRAGISRQCLLALSDAAPLGGAAAVVGDGGDVLDLQAGGLEGADGRLPARARALDEDVDLADAVLLGPAGGLLGRELGRERGRLARTLEPDVARRRPRDRVALGVGDGHDRVVEAGLDVGMGVGDVLLLATPRLLGSGLLRWQVSRLLLLLRGLLLAGNGLLGALAGAGVGVGALAAHGQPPAVPGPLVAADLDLALDVLLDLPAQVAFDLVVGVDPVPEADDLLLGQVADAGVGVHPGALDRLDGPGAAEAEDVGEADLHPLFAGEVDAGDACHVCSVPPAPAISPAAACGGDCCR